MELKKMMMFRCEDCAHVVEILFAGPCGCDMECCGKKMKFLDEKAKDGAGEKHVPVVEADGSGIKIKVGEVAHPMEADHWIQIIEVVTKDGYVIRKELNPGDAPEASFYVSMDRIETVRELCNKHGLWVKE
ncbi:MAG TPA: desulfoferrodoxin [Firmicutes bacterium]|nr:desulfoferrodoxin [Bacillota bacterium]